MNCVALVTDMIFETKIRTTADSIGVSVETTASIDEFRAALDATSPGLVIVDLNVTCGSPAEAVGVAKAHPSAPRVLAYCSHVQTIEMRAAEDAGADEVWPRSRFNTRLPLLLQDLMNDSTAR